jgi:uncharacterized protein
MQAFEITMTFMMNLLHNIWLVYLDTAFWLLLGLLAAGLVKAYIPANAMQRWVGGRGLPAILRATAFGAPLPLCSCGVLPAALGLRRSGASKEATVAFLIATPETSIDSVALTYALLGPVMAVYRPLAAVISAIVAGLLTGWVDQNRSEQSSKMQSTLSSASACCATNSSISESACCDTNATADCCVQPAKPVPQWLRAIRFAAGELLDDISHWLVLGIVIAGIIMTIIPPGWLAQWGGGLPAMLVMLAVGIPMYICATASTPVAAGLLLAGVSPGAVLVFLLAGPATNVAGLILVRRELGQRVMLAYLTGIAVVSVVMGLLLDALIGQLAWQVQVEPGTAQNMLPAALVYGSAGLLLLLAVPGIRNRMFPVFAG